MSLQSTKGLVENVVNNSKILLCDNKTYFFKPVTQLAYLMKAHVINGLPDQVKNVELNENAIDKKGKDCFHKMFTQTRACGVNGMWAAPSSLHLPLISNIISKSIQYNGNLNNKNGMNVISNFKTGFGYKSYINNIIQFNGHVDRLYLNEKPLSNIKLTEDILYKKLEWDQIFNPTFHLKKENISVDFKYPIPLSYPTLTINFDLRIKQAINRAIINGIAIGGVMAAIINEISFDCLLNGNLPEVLQNPYTLKLLAFDGRSISTMILQINTLDFKNLKGIKNILWFETPKIISKFAPSVMFVRRNKISHIPRWMIKRQTFTYIDEDFEFQPIIDMMKFLHF